MQCKDEAKKMKYKGVAQNRSDWSVNKCDVNTKTLLYAKIVAQRVQCALCEALPGAHFYGELQ